MAINRCSVIARYIFISAFSTNCSGAANDGTDPEELQIVGSHINFTNPDHYEQSYPKINDVLIKNRPNKDLLTGEYYTFLQINNRFNDDVIIAQCGESSKNWFLAVNLRIDY